MTGTVIPWTKPTGTPVDPPRWIKRPCDHGLYAAVVDLETLAQAAQALLHGSQASGQPIPARTAASVTRAIASEVRHMRALSGPQRVLIEGPDA